MTPQQREKLNRFLAERVLGWREGDHPEKHGTGQWMSEYDWPVWFTGDGVEFIISDAFNPLENLADCEPLLDKIEQEGWRWEIGMTDNQRYYAKVDKNCNPWVVAVISCASKTEALCLAIAKAYGWKEDV